MLEISGRYGTIAYVLMPEISGSIGSERVKNRKRLQMMFQPFFFPESLIFEANFALILLLLVHTIVFNFRPFLIHFSAKWF